MTLSHVTTRVIADVNRHAGQADLVRELIDGAVGWQQGNENLELDNAQWWEDQHRRLDEVARQFR